MSVSVRTIIPSIFDLDLKGYTPQEIGAKLGVWDATVRKVLNGTIYAEETREHRRIRDQAGYAAYMKVKKEYIKNHIADIFELDKYLPKWKIARIFDTDQDTIRNVLRGQTYKNLTRELADKRVKRIGCKRTPVSDGDSHLAAKAVRVKEIVESTNISITRACEEVGISRQTYWRYSKFIDRQTA